MTEDEKSDIINQRIDSIVNEYASFLETKDDSKVKALLTEYGVASESDKVLAFADNVDGVIDFLYQKFDSIDL